MKTQGQIGIYHANGKGTGCAIKIELHPAHDEVDGSVFVRFAPQKTVGSVANGTHVYPTFDWDNALTLRLVIGEIASMIEVFRGVTESIADGKGLFHRTRDANIVFRMEHRIEPCPGYRISVSRRLVESEELREAAIILTPTEAFAIALALESSMSRIAFGD